MKKITTFAASLLAVACMSTSAAAAEQPLEKIAPFPKAEQGDEASGDSAAAAAG